MSINLADELFRSVQQIWVREFRTRAPECVWHYTNEEGLKKILEKTIMWATSIKHLNDENEFLYGQGLVDEILGLKESESTDLGPLIREVRNSIDLFRTRREVYVVSFSSECDSRHQWTTYGTYALGFLSPQLSSRRLRERDPLELRWCEVEYEKTKQLTELGAVVDCWCNYLRRKRDRNEELSVDDIGSKLAEHLIRFPCRFKEEGQWAAEKEWRLVYSPTVENPDEVKSRCSENRITRYRELDLSVELETSSHGAEVGMLPMREVMHGPTLAPVPTIEFLSELLRQSKYLTVCASSSRLSP